VAEVQIVARFATGAGPPLLEEPDDEDEPEPLELEELEDDEPLELEDGTSVPVMA